MSGGHFDYAYSRVLTFADDLESDLRAPAEHDICEPLVHATLTALAQDARTMAALMKAAEWLFSGDIGHESFMEEVKRIKEQKA